MKLVTTEFKPGGLHEKHVVATWNHGNHLSICLGNISAKNRLSSLELVTHTKRKDMRYIFGQIEGWLRLISRRQAVNLFRSVYVALPLLL